MTRKALIVKQKRLSELREKCFKEWKKMKNPTKYYNRCQVTWRVGSYMREFGVDRITFRKLAREWKIMWVKKASR